MITAQGLCLDCGTIRRRPDILGLAVGISALAMYIVFPVSVEIFTRIFNLGATAVNIITVLSYIIPVSTAVDAIVMARKRRQTHKFTMVGLVLGIIGVVIGISLLLWWFLSL